jgi:hypothetical protein
MSDRAAHFNTLVKEAAERLKISPESREARHVALMFMVDEAYQARAIAGHLVPIVDLLRLDEALQPYMPRPAEPEHKIEIEFVHGKRVCCPSCKTEFDPHDPAPKPLPPVQPPGQPATPVAAATDAKPFSRPGTVVEIPKKRPDIGAHCRLRLTGLARRLDGWRAWSSRRSRVIVYSVPSSTRLCRSGRGAPTLLLLLHRDHRRHF